MSVINILSPHLADLIAAGEVVERPASVIKELVENSIDAGARSITVEIRNGGATFIRVTDDGCGMAPEDAGIAFVRHATSKLQDEQGLNAIGTMGFRGEALAAISSVSRIELTSRRPEDMSGVFVSLDAGEIQDMHETGCPSGTTMIVRDLFYNTPARLKFLKSDRSEGSACAAAALRCALGHPEISVRFIRDSEELFFSPGDGKTDSCIYSLLGRDTASAMLRCESEADGLSLSGYISTPASCRGNRSGQYFFCNGRFIKSASLQAALEQAYKNSLLTGRYPGCVLYLTIPLGAVDVNVHPAKTEVKFSGEKSVFDLVYYGVLSALEGEKAHVSTASVRTSGEKSGFYKSMSASEFRANGYSAGAKPAATLKSSSGAVYTQTRLDLPDPAPAAKISQIKSAPPAPAEACNTSSVTAGKAAVSSAPAAEIPSPPEKTPECVDKIVENPVQNVEKLPVPDHKIVGEAFKKYIITEVGEELILIDKHAAHERMIFDRLKSGSSALMAQSLLETVPMHLCDDDAEVFDANGALFEELGFEIERLGFGDILIRSVPADMFCPDAAAAVEEICLKLRTGKAPDRSSARDDILHTVACKAAIKAGWDTSVEELETIVREVLSGRVLYCPHGRPVSFVMSSRDLDKAFKRIL